MKPYFFVLPLFDVITVLRSTNWPHLGSQKDECFVHTPHLLIVIAKSIQLIQKYIRIYRARLVHDTLRFCLDKAGS